MTTALSSVQWSDSVFQNPDDQLFSPTVFEDVAFGPLHMGLPEAEVRARVDSALEAVRMTSYKDRPSHHLSVGEKTHCHCDSVVDESKRFDFGRTVRWTRSASAQDIDQLVARTADHNAGLDA
ncbi:hypothetical protein [Candidatus Villigracilis saccharophilus]|uniref:hypothetical protein n=1 Tax=Candidatus Villigracilis saccharophilus TaxID=3140684 RepID=UPI0031F00116